MYIWRSKEQLKTKIMLDYEKLSVEFDNLLKEVTKETYEAWVDFDELRAIAYSVQNGDRVTIQSNSISNEIENINCKKPANFAGFLFNKKYVCLYYGTTKQKCCN